MSEFEQQKDYQQFHKAYQQSANELPDEAVDAAILSAAHKAVEQDNVAGIDTQPVKRAWYVPLSYVAILVISLSVVMKLAFEPVPETPFESEKLSGQMSKKEIAQGKLSPSAKEESSAGMSADTVTDSVVEFSLQQKPVAAPSQFMAREEKIMDQELESRSRQKNMMAVKPQAEQPATGMMSQPRRVTSADTAESLPAVAALSAQTTEKADTLVDEQAIAIKELEQLLENKMIVELRNKLQDYRKKYPITEQPERLPESLLQWEKLNMPENITGSTEKDSLDTPLIPSP